MDVQLVKRFRIEAAHATRQAGEEAQLHGHSYHIDVVAEGPCNPELGWLVDYGDISSRFEHIHEALDHRLLNEVAGLDHPGLEGLQTWIHERMRQSLEVVKHVHVSIVGACELRVERLGADEVTGLPERLRFGFEAAHALPRLRKHHKCRRMHGHSFSVEIAASDLDALRPHIDGLYEKLDHSCLNNIEGLENPTSEEVSRWIWRALESDGAGPTAVSVAETCSARCIYRGT